MAETDQKEGVTDAQAADAQPAEDGAETAEPPVDAVAGDVSTDAEPAEPDEVHAGGETPAPADVAVEPAEAAVATPASAAAAKVPAAGRATVRLRITQIGSPIGRKAYQRANLVALGLNKMHRSRVVTGTPSMRGRIERVKHLLKVEEL